MLSFVRFFQWLFSARIFMRLFIAFFSVITLVTIAWQFENWRGRTKWEKWKTEWEAKGVRFTLKPPLGASGSRRAIITFTDPVTTGGLVIELVQALKEGDENPDWVQL